MASVINWVYVYFLYITCFTAYGSSVRNPRPTILNLANLKTKKKKKIQEILTMWFSLEKSFRKRLFYNKARKWMDPNHQTNIFQKVVWELSWVEAYRVHGQYQKQIHFQRHKVWNLSGSPKLGVGREGVMVGLMLKILIKF